MQFMHLFCRIQSIFVKDEINTCQKIFKLNLNRLNLVYHEQDTIRSERERER